MKRLRLLWSTAIVVTVTSVVMAQVDKTCPAIVRSALESARLACADTGRNQACYANSMLDAELHANRSDVKFEQVGDRVEMEAINSLRLSAMDEAVSQWGVALMEVQANIPDSSPENVTLLMFGDVEVQDVGSSLPTARLETTANLNIRRGSSLNSAVVASADAGETVVANGRLADNSWVRIQLPNDAIGYGWMHASGLTGPIEQLTVVEPSEPVYGPMQAFTLQTGVDDAACEEAPASGLLIQTPEGVGEVRLVLNHVSVRLGSTVFFQAQRGGDLHVSVFEGHAVLTVGDEMQYVPAGAHTTVPMTPDLQPAGPPEPAQPYTPDAFTAFTPVVTTLPQTIRIAEPLPVEQLEFFHHVNDPVNLVTSIVDVDVVGNTVNTTVNHVTGAVDNVAGTVDNVVGTVIGENGVVETVVDGLPVGGELVGGALDVVQDTGVTEVVGQTVDTVTDTVDQTTNTVTETTDTVVGVVEDTTGTVVDDIVEGAPVDNVLDEVEDILGGLLGR